MARRMPAPSVAQTPHSYPSAPESLRIACATFCALSVT